MPVKCVNRFLAVLPPDHARYLDSRCNDHLDVDTVVRERLEHSRRYAGMRSHAGADQADLGDLFVVVTALSTQGLHDTVRYLSYLLHIILIHRERDVRPRPVADVLDDHVNVDISLGE